MKISTKGRYALRLMLDIAKYGEEGPVRVKEIAKRQEISMKYLEQIISILAKVGYVRSTRGPQGGYRLSKAPEEYTVGMILKLTEGNLAPVECLVAPENTCGRAEECVTLRIWKELNEAIESVVEKYTIADLMEWEKERGNNYII
ncbi:MAG: RrF2 family transcriptional regulator [Lachnospiraceae bacterium]